jgi:hypothetical protein
MGQLMAPSFRAPRVDPPFLDRQCIAWTTAGARPVSKAWQRYGFVDAFNPLTGW